jgi:hypothetical protein
MIEYFMGRIIPGVPLKELDAPLLVGLAEAMGLLRKDVVSLGSLGEEAFFSSANSDSLASPFDRIKWVGLPSLRSEYISKLQIIPEALKTMREVTSRLRSWNDFVQSFQCLKSTSTGWCEPLRITTKLMRFLSGTAERGPSSTRPRN